MKPLLYLTLNQFKNGVIRAASSPKRLIALLFFLGYYFLIFGRPGSGSGGFGTSRPAGMGQLDFPPMQVVEAIVFGMLALISLFMLLGAANQQSAFKPADVDVLFATPITPKAVLIFRMIRDYFLTLIVPLFIVLLSMRPAQMGWQALFRNFPNPEYANIAFRALTVGWLLIAMAWIAISYAISLFINRSDKRSDWNKRFLAISVAGLILFIGGYLYGSLKDASGLQEVLQVAEAPVTKVVFFSATLATQMVMAPLNGQWAAGAIGLFGLVGIIWIALKVAMTQAEWMYDQAAVKGFGANTLRDLQRKGDVLGFSAEMARRGKVNTRRGRFLSKIRALGPWALVWKEAFLQLRGMMAMLVFLGLFAVFIAVVPALIPEEAGTEAPRYMIFLMQGASLLAITMPLAQIGFVEVLRRVDLLKPLPFSSMLISLAEVTSRAALGVLASLIGSIGIAIAKPHLAVDALASTILIVGLSMLMSAGVWLVTILFPDVDDHTQRQFRGFVTMIAVAVLGFFPVALFAACWLILRWPSPVAALVGCASALVVSLGACSLSGRLYENFNPSE